jgi:HAD superfamily hydrolase (TIGR01549 family)
MAKIRNIILDVDGTILDSMKDIAGAQHWVLGQLGVTSYRPADLYQHIGAPLRDTFRKLLPEQLHDRIESAAAMYREYYRAHALDTTTLYEGVRETLDELMKREIRLGVATIKSTQTTTRILAHFDILNCFVHIQGTEEPPYKPHPAVINKILRARQWQQNETLMVGDTDKDIGAGRNAGVLTCGVTWGALRREQILAFSPDYAIDSIRELLDLVDGSNDREG